MFHSIPAGNPPTDTDGRLDTAGLRLTRYPLAPDNGDRYLGSPSIFKAELALLARGSEQLMEVMECIDSNRDRYYSELELRRATERVLW